MLSLAYIVESGNLLLLVASRNQIVADNITSHSQHIYSLVRDGRNIVAIDFDSVTDRIFWSDTTQDKIWSAYKNGTDRKVVSLLLHAGSIVFQATSFTFLIQMEQGGLDWGPFHTALDCNSLLR